MAKPISKFFLELGCPLRNVRWSWGALVGEVLLLRTWDDEYTLKDKTVTVLREPERYLQSDSFGLDERIVHLKALWAGGVAGYTVIAKVKDPTAHPRETEYYRDDVVFSIKQLLTKDDGTLVALIGDQVPTTDFRVHSATHRTKQGEGVFPVDDEQRSGVSTTSYQQKIPAIRAWLIDVCKSEGAVTYSEVMDRFGLTYYPLRNAMARLGHDCKKAGEPIITALIVDKETRRCSQGLFDEFQIVDDEIERRRCYLQWGTAAMLPLAASSGEVSQDQKPDPQSSSFEERVARFAQVEVRPQQQAFRDAVFRACGGRCVVSGCDVPEALEAAHLIGRDWRKGENSAEDGILLRRDLHTLYDRGLLTIQESGEVVLDPKVGAHYGMFDGILVKP